MKINKLFPLLLISTLSLVACSKNEYQDVFVTEGDADVILIYGQSNATGCTYNRYLKQNDFFTYERFVNGLVNVPIAYSCENNNKNEFFTPTHLGMGFNNECYGLEIGIADEFFSSNMNKHTYIIKWAWSGSNLHKEWLDGSSNRGRYYSQAISFTKKHLDTLVSRNVTISSLTACWMQGESDSINRENVEAYQNDETAFISYLREDLINYAPRVNFVDAYISTRSVWLYADEINTAKENIANKDEYVACIKTNGEDEDSIDLYTHCEPDGNDLAHYDSKSMLMLGKEFAKKAIELIDK